MNKGYIAAAILGLGALAVSKKLRRMSVSMERVNREAREKYPTLTRRDIEYMRKVRERMMLGYECKHPPLYS